MLGAAGYDEDKLQQFVADLAPARAHNVVQALIDLLAGFGDGIDDDVAILAIGIPPGPVKPSPHPRRRPPMTPGRTGSADPRPGR
jgi:hypothetical protein